MDRLRRSRRPAGAVRAAPPRSARRPRRPVAARRPAGRCGTSARRCTRRRGTRTRIAVGLGFGPGDPRGAVARPAPQPLRRGLVPCEGSLRVVDRRPQCRGGGVDRRLQVTLGLLQCRIGGRRRWEAAGDVVEGRCWSSGRSRSTAPSWSSWVVSAMICWRAASARLSADSARTPSPMWSSAAHADHVEVRGEAFQDVVHGPVGVRRDQHPLAASRAFPRDLGDRGGLAGAGRSEHAQQVRYVQRPVKRLELAGVQAGMWCRVGLRVVGLNRPSASAVSTRMLRARPRRSVSIASSCAR